MKGFYLDVQTRNREADLKKFGAGYYSRHELTRVLFVTFCSEEGTVYQWDPWEMERFPKRLSEWLDNPSLEMRVWYADFTSQIMRNVLETPNQGRTVCISSVCRNHKAPTYFLDWYAGERYSVGMPYSRSSLEITEWVNLFSIRGEHPHDNGVAWTHFKGACQRRLFAMRTAHRHLLYGDDDEEESPI